MGTQPVVVLVAWHRRPLPIATPGGHPRTVQRRGWGCRHSSPCCQLAFLPFVLQTEEDYIPYPSVHEVRLRPARGAGGCVE